VFCRVSSAIFVDKVILKNDRDGGRHRLLRDDDVLDIVLGVLAAVVVAGSRAIGNTGPTPAPRPLMGRKQPMFNALARLGGLDPGELPKTVANMGISSRPSGMMALAVQPPADRGPHPAPCSRRSDAGRRKKERGPRGPRFSSVRGAARAGSAAAPRPALAGHVSGWKGRAGQDLAENSRSWSVAVAAKPGFVLRRRSGWPAPPGAASKVTSGCSCCRSRCAGPAA